MNDPASIKPRKALRCDFGELIQELAKGVQVVEEKFISLKKGTVSLSNQHKLPYDQVVFTIPLWAIRGNVPFYVPHGVAMKLNIAAIMPTRDTYAKWDYVYTPYTPANCIHRFSPYLSGYVVEANGEYDELSLHSDLGFIFPDGYHVERIRTGLKGHLIPLQQPPEWPENVAPLGRFAQWDPRATADVVLDNAKELAQKWIGQTP